MTIYVTSQQRQALYQSSNDPVARYLAMQPTDVLKGRPPHDVREEIVVTTDPDLLAKGLVFDAKPSKKPPAGGDAPQ